MPQFGYSRYLLPLFDHPGFARFLLPDLWRGVSPTINPLVREPDCRPAELGCLTRGESNPAATRIVNAPQHEPAGRDRLREEESRQGQPGLRRPAKWSRNARRREG